MEAKPFGTSDDPLKKFHDLEYVRPDISLLKKNYKRLIAAFKRAPDLETANKLLLRMQELESETETTYSIAAIRNTMDTTDTFYDKEIAFFNKALPQLIPTQKKYLKALLQSPHRPGLEAKYGSQLFRQAELDEKTQSIWILTDKIKESNLKSAYKKLAASCKTDFRGEVCNFYGLLRHMESADRNERREAFLAWAGLYEQNAAKLDELFDKLIAVRVRMARKLHFDNYTSFAYLNRHRIDYTAVDAARFRDQVRRVVVPACMRIRERQAARIGVEKLKYYDETFMFPDGNADPIGNKDEMIQEARAMYRELSPETAEFFDSMVEHELFDLETRPGKHLGGYCSSLPKYKVPFIFSNFNGTSADVDVLTHEAGHAFEYYLASRTQVLAEYAHSTSEINEIHSMSMEHFTYPWMEKFFGDKADSYRYAHLCSALTVIPYLVAVDEFQHRIYEKPEMSADDRRSVWREIEQIYLPWRDYDGMGYMEKGGFWMQKQHIFVYPFYYIEYALAQMGAFAFYGKMKTDRAGAWADYLRLCQAGGSLGYFELLKLAYLPNPFVEGSVEQTVAHVIAEIENSPWH